MPVKKLLPITFFAIALAFIEAVVVVYLRELYYPEGFYFPLKLMPPGILLTEVLREIAAIVAIAAVSLANGKNRIAKLAIFLFIFGVWDVFYYVWLKALINWPESLLTWDILFLIPVTWVAPVLAPVIVSIVMIIMAISILYIQTKTESPVKFNRTLFILGAVVIFISFIWNTWNTNLVTIQPTASDFPWLIFIIGVLLWCFLPRIILSTEKK